MPYVSPFTDIFPGRTYQVLATAPFDYYSGGRPRLRGKTFVADSGDANNGYLKLGVSRGHIILVADTSAAASLVGVGVVSTAAASTALTGYGTAFSALTDIGKVITVSGQVLEPTAGPFNGTIVTATNSTAVTGTGTNFAAGDVNKALYSGSTFLGVVSAYTSATSITLAANAAAAVSGAAWAYTGVVTAATNSAVVTGTNTTFVAGDVGKVLYANGVRLGTIGTYTSATSVTLLANSLAAVTNQPYTLIYTATSLGQIVSVASATSATLAVVAPAIVSGAAFTTSVPADFSGAQFIADRGDIAKEVQDAAAYSEQDSGSGAVPDEILFAKAENVERASELAYDARAVLMSGFANGSTSVWGYAGIPAGTVELFVGPVGSQVSKGQTSVLAANGAGTITAVTTSTALTGSGTNFVGGDVGKQIFAVPVGQTQPTYIGTISAVNSTNSVTLTANAAQNVTNASYSYLATALEPTAGPFNGTIVTTTSSTAVTGTGTNFAAGDVNKALYSGSTFLGIVSAYTSATSITLAANAAAAVSGAAWSYTGVITTTTSSAAVTGTNSVFVAGDVGKALFSGSTYLGMIASFTSATSVTLAANAAAAVTNAAYSVTTAGANIGTFSYSGLTALATGNFVEVRSYYDGFVSSTTVTAPGSGYTSAPAVLFSNPDGTGTAQPPGTVAAAATAVLSGATVGSLTLTNHGSGYLVAPTVTISGGGGSGATATATLTYLNYGSTTATI